MIGVKAFNLHPEEFHSSPPGERVASMMSPSLLLNGDEVELVIGSGGFKRIRTAITQVLTRLIDFKRESELAVQSPRLHYDDKVLQFEPGFCSRIHSSSQADYVGEYLAGTIHVFWWGSCCCSR